MTPEQTAKTAREIIERDARRLLPEFEVLRFRYEILHESIEDLARAAGTNKDVITLMVEVLKWERLQEIDDEREAKFRKLVRAAKLRVEALRVFKALDSLKEIYKTERQLLARIQEQIPYAQGSTLGSLTRAVRKLAEDIHTLTPEIQGETPPKVEIEIGSC